MNCVTYVAPENNAPEQPKSFQGKPMVGEWLLSGRQETARGRSMAKRGAGRLLGIVGLR